MYMLIPQDLRGSTTSRAKKANAIKSSRCVELESWSTTKKLTPNSRQDTVVASDAKNTSKESVLSNVIKVGDRVSWRGGFGTHDPIEVTVTSLEVTDLPRDKFGKDVDGVTWDLVKENRVNFGLSSGKWAYADQIAPVGQDPNHYHDGAWVSHSELKDLFAIMNGTKRPY